MRLLNMKWATSNGRPECSKEHRSGGARTHVRGHVSGHVVHHVSGHMVHYVSCHVVHHVSGHLVALAVQTLPPAPTPTKKTSTPRPLLPPPDTPLARVPPPPPCAPFPNPHWPSNWGHAERRGRQLSAATAVVGHLTTHELLVYACPGFWWSCRACGGYPSVWHELPGSVGS